MIVLMHGWPEIVKRAWAGEPVDEGVGPCLARTCGRESVIGASAPADVQRAGSWAAGFVAAGGGNPARSV